MFYALVAAALAIASNIYVARVIDVIDGDTIRVEISLTDDLSLTTSIRVRGIDTPELRGKCAAERALAERARSALRSLLPPDTRVTISRLARDKYGGRYDADVETADGRSLARALIDAGLARPYTGGPRRGWC
jgi:endonuclease YncB( thermonuclease family)